jgi:hypothetical protein
MRHLYSILLFLLSLATFGQNTWPSEDAEWNYITYWGFPPSPSVSTYTKYHVDGVEVVQGKLCSKLFVDAYSNGVNFTEGTTPSHLLHFDGDTLWHLVTSDSTFYPLICFNAVPGDSWHPLPTTNPAIDTLCTIMPIEVLDTFMVNHNGETYRGIHLGNQQMDGHLRWGGRFDERTFKNPDLNASGLLFPFYNGCPEGGVIDWNSNDLLCFSDADLSIIKSNISSYAGNDDCEYPWNLVGIEEPTFQFSIYPNPATDNLRIESQTPLAEVKLTDLTGRVAWQETLRSTQRNKAIDISHLPSGIYLLEAFTKDGRRSVQKVVVQ